MLWAIVVVLIILWVLGFFGPVVIPTLPHFGPWIHILIVIAIVLIVLELLGVI
ncbi:MAG: lmo0937 family membrane protein [Anaerolineales bacterium]